MIISNRSMASHNKILSGSMLWLNVLLILLNLAIFAPYVAASKRMGSSSDLNRDSILQFGADLDPPNDDCEGAIIIPSSFPGISYTTAGVSMMNASLGLGGPPNRCQIPSLKDVWYQFTPAITSYYDFTMNLGKENIAVFIDGGFTGATCNNAVLQYCPKFRPRIPSMPLKANQTYYIYVQPVLTTKNHPLKLTVLRQTPPSNNQCTNAIVLDPTLPQMFMTGNSSYAIHDKTADFLCNTNERAATFWYKFTNPYPYKLSLVSAFESRTSAADVLQITAFHSRDCTSLQCVDGSFDSFVADAFATYYILLQVYGQKPVVFWANSIVSRSFSSVVDSQTDDVFQQLQDLRYDSLSSSSLNFRVSFDSQPETIKSARMTFDNPRRNFCERAAPYSVFGDTKGNYQNATIPLGQHTVTATPFTQANCTGSAGATLRQTFNITGCFVYYEIYRSNGRDIGMYTFAAVPPLILSCNIDIGSIYICGFQPNTVHVELRNGTTNELIRNVTQESPKFLPISLFSVIPASRESLIGHLLKGSYTITTTIDNVKHKSFAFTVVNTTCGI